MKRSFFVSIIILLSASGASAGPISPSRGILIVPVWKGHGDSTTNLDAITGWGSVYHGFNSASDAFGWSIDMGMIAELVRWGDRSALLGISDMELTANTHNDISFNPSGGVWEEGILYVQNDKNLDWEFGYLHRCRHDVDNGDTTQFSQQPLERTLIYGSITSKWIFHPLQIAGSARNSIQPWISADLYVFREDYRQPPAAFEIEPDFSTLLATVSFGGLWRIAPIGAGEWYANGGLDISAFGAHGSYFHSFTHVSTTTLDARLELGCQFEGLAGRFQVFAGVESFNDDEASPFPEKSSFALVGVRLSGISLTR